MRLLVLSFVVVALAMQARGDGGGGGSSEALAEEAEVLASAGFTVTHHSGKSDNLVARLLTGEDSAIAAVRFCDAQGFGSDHSTMLDVARNLDKNLKHNGNGERAEEASVAAYPKLKTAGAYKKRAKAASADDRHADAAADYLRALLRPGTLSRSVSCGHPW